NEPRRRGRLAGSRGAKQHDIGLARVDSSGEFRNRSGLVTARNVLADDLKGPDGARDLHPSSLCRTTDRALAATAVPSARSPTSSVYSAVAALSGRATKDCHNRSV